MQDTVVNKNTQKRVHRKYGLPPIFNYGFIPRTWSDSDLGGDGDPIDLVDVSWKELKPVLAVSDYLVLGVLGLIDQGELDYKIIAIEATEAHERGIKNLKDYSMKLPNSLEAIKVWFRDYKLLEGKKQNKFVWNGEILSADKAMEILHESNQHYKLLLQDKQRMTEKSYWFKSSETTQKM